MEEPDRARLGKSGLGLRLRELRLAAGLSLAEAAGRAGLSLSYLSDIERGRRLPSLDALDALGHSHDLLVAELLHDVYPCGTRTPRNDLQPPPDGRRTTNPEHR